VLTGPRILYTFSKSTIYTIYGEQKYIDYAFAEITAKSVDI
jgi:hypothetical protein